MKTKRWLFIMVLGLSMMGVLVGYMLMARQVPNALASQANSISRPEEVRREDNDDPPTATVKLIFVHHSCGGHWLADTSETDYPAGGLAQALMNNNYFVSATNYGWGPGSIGSNTDIPNWPDWFTGPDSDTVLNALYNEFGQNVCGDGMCFGNWTRMADPDPSRENQVIMFKSCFPNSNLYGNPDDPPLDEPNDQYTVENAKAVYNDILTYFTSRQDKLFVVITAPPLLEGSTTADRAVNARAFNDWLVNDWLSSYPHSNVAVFDFYNVLTSNGGDPNTNDVGAETGNHHRWWSGAVQHVHPVSNNYAAYAVGGDNHPTAAGNIKATAEFVPLLNVYYNRWRGGGAPPPSPTLTLTAPNGGEAWQVGSQQEIRWTGTGTITNVSLAYSNDNFASSNVTIISSTANDGSYTWTIPNNPDSAVRVRVASVVSPTVRDDSDADFAIVSGASTESYIFHADITPRNATAPVTYTWSPEPTSGQGTASVTYDWAPGTYDITVAATNCGGTFTDEHRVTIGMTSLVPYSKNTTQAMLSFQDGVNPSTSYSGTTDVPLDNGEFITANMGIVDQLETFFGADAEVRRSLIRWDLSALPPDITVSAATIALYHYHAGASNDMQVALYSITREWAEGNGNFSPSPGGATWLTATAGTPWTNPGGDYDNTILDQTTIPTDTGDTWIRLDATDAVRAWVAGSAPNYGLLLRPLSGEYTYHYYHSRECVTPTLRPRLVITYTSGAPAPTLDITAPTGSTSWPVSSTQQIAWTTTGNVSHINLHYSTDGFVTSATIGAPVTNGGVYTWTTPPTATTSAQVRVESVVSPTTVYDVSETFSLIETTASSYTVYLPLVLGNHASEPPSCPYPLTGVAIRGPITKTPPSSSLVQPGDLIYQGAFRLPGGDDPPQTFAYGGNAMTFNPDGDLDNPGAYPGSLFITGHDRLAGGTLPNGDQVAELSIPTPSIASDLASLPQASFIQNFHDATAGYFTALEEIPKVGMQYLNHADTGPLVHLCWGQHLQPPGVPSHAWFSANLAMPNLQGVWFIGNHNLYSTNAYMFDIPSAWAAAHTEGRMLATGRMRDGGQGGMGPTLFAYRPWQAGGTAPVSGTHLSETTLLLYENVYNTPEITRCLDGYQHPDEWEGGAWITTPSGKSTVLFAGTKSNGTKYWYGYIHPDGPEYPCVDNHVADFLTCRMVDGSSCPPEDFAGCCDEDAGTCVSYRGWWSTHFDAQFILYDPADLAQVAGGTMEPWEPQPYTAMDIDEYLYLDPPEGDALNLGWGDQRRYRIGPAAYDRENGYLYVLEQYADGGKPVVHVWHVQ